MKVISCELYRYNRMAVGGNEYFHYTPTTPVQIILGTNGTGKSSLLHELFPLPAASDQYSANGYKLVHYEHLGKEYKTHSYFRSGKDMRHSLTVFEDGEWVELNPGGTQRVHMELCKDIFGITPLIRQVLLSKDKFSSMSTQARRELFTLMSDADYTYGFKVHRALQKRARHVDGVVVFLKESIVSKTAMLIKDDERQSIQKDIQSLEASLERVQALRTPYNEQFQTVEHKIDNTLRNLKQITHEVLTYRIPYPNQAVHDPEHIRLQLGLNENQLKLLQQSRRDLTNEHATLKEAGASMAIVGGRDSETIANVIKTIDTTIASHHTTLLDEYKDHIRDHPQDLERIYHSFVNAYPALMDIFASLAPNDDLRFSNARYQTCSDQASEQLAKVNTLIQQRYKLEQQIAHYEHHLKSDQVQCPKCQHSWFIGYDATAHHQAKEALGELFTQIPSEQAKVSQINEELQQISEFISRYRDFTNIVNQTPELQFLWQVLQSDHIAFQYPGKARGLIQSFHTSMDTILDLSKLHRQRDVELRALELARAIDQRHVEQTNAKLASIESEVLQVTQQYQELIKENSSLQLYLDSLEDFTRLGNTLETLIESLQAQEGMLVDREEHLVIAETVSLIQRTLSGKVDILAMDANERKVIEEQQQQLLEHEAIRQSLKLLIKSLSPTEGIIAKGLTGFINNFLGQMNKVINSIWSYEMELLPCDIEDGTKPDLNYRFPVRIQNQPTPLKDIAEASTGQREIVDMAYRISCIRYLGLEESPLFLDEFGAGFDEYHQNAINNAIKTIIEQMGFEQTFIISHNKASWSAMAGAQVCVTCDDNVEIPKDIPHALIVRTKP